MVRPTQMPLPKARPRNPYQALMYTFGPIRPDITREQVIERARTYLQNDLRTIRAAFEVSENGYHHCHVAVDLAQPRKPAMRLVRDYKTFCAEDADGRKPNCGINYVPNSESRGKRAYAVLDEYLHNPKKIKYTDDGSLEMKIPPFMYGSDPGQYDPSLSIMENKKRLVRAFQALNARLRDKAKGIRKPKSHYYSLS